MPCTVRILFTGDKRDRTVRVERRPSRRLQGVQRSEQQLAVAHFLTRWRPPAPSPSSPTRPHHTLSGQGTAMTARGFCLILLLLVGRAEETDQEQIWGSDQYDFAIVLQAAELRCFWHFAHVGEQFYLNYMVQWVTGLANDRHLSVTVNSPSGYLVGQADDASHQISFLTKETGFYQMCFSNFHNRFGSMQIFMNFGVYYEGSEDKDEGPQEKKEELNSTLSTIQDSSHRLQGLVFHMWRHYNFGRMQRGADYYMMVSNSNYVSRWSAVQSLVILLAGYLQLFFIKRLFNTKPTTDTEKPRC
ncbi:transmembrane emp24 domain-containing protein 6-like [Denticeps clupeoides]|uniref:GOLD domain-containing protein n=1 Tax=Denticeps clupeoides TaxID=299321 RepID=A0AAY4D7N6_9TELE|nr:transmembrane emp24 domain-containing protein 6-like [Denticeps clupeoides]